jgi:methionyl-tRNA formyltransferase
MRIQILCDNKGSWIIPFAKNIITILSNTGHSTTLVYSQDEVEEGDILLLLSCENIFRKLHLNAHNLVAHASALPKGKGWSPLTWQILEGKNNVPVTLFEAVEKVDAGQIYGQSIIEYDGTELIDELRNKMGKTIELLFIDFVETYPNIIGIEQIGESSYYKKRKPEESKLDTDKSIGEQFNLLRISDNDKYPAYFEKGGIKYILKIYKA